MAFFFSSLALSVCVCVLFRLLLLFIYVFNAFPLEKHIAVARDRALLVSGTETD